MKLVNEAIAMGVVVVIVGTVVGLVVGRAASADLPPVCKNWNKNYVMEISLFITGAVAHLLFERFGRSK